MGEADPVTAGWTTAIAAAPICHGQQVSPGSQHNAEGGF